jgi:hypothetical protein
LSDCSGSEAAKLVTAGWLAGRWRATAWVWRLVLVALVADLAIINAAGVCAQLVAANAGSRGEATSVIETQDATLAARIEVAAHNVADLDRRVGQIDSLIEEAAKRGRTNAALSAIEASAKPVPASRMSENGRPVLGTRPQGRARLPGRPKPPDRDRGRAHPLRGRDSLHPSITRRWGRSTAGPFHYRTQRPFGFRARGGAA